MRLGFVGAGNMAGGLARGWAAARGQTGAPEAMLFSDADRARAEELAEEVGGQAVEGNEVVADAADLVILAVKPSVLDEVAPELVDAGTPVLSILAGTTLKRLEEALPGIDLIRVMPNLGAQLRQGVFCIAYGETVGDRERQRIAELLGAIGDVIELEEGLIDAATALMSCSPGYLALIAEVLVEAGVREGLDEGEALRMVAGAIKATGALLDLHRPEALKRAVASPGGMTEAGLEALEQGGIREALGGAVDASLEVARR
jgi:pyrroline-5-carboxylate reductase